MNDAHAAAHDEDASERDAIDRLTRVHGVAELHATILALLLPAGSRRAVRAWRLEAAAAHDSEALRRHAGQLSAVARLPWLERLVARVAAQPLTARQALLQSTRRVMGARGIVRPIDRLHWLVIRRGLGEVPPVSARHESSVEVAEWLESDVLAIAAYSAFLSRMIVGDLADDGDAETWYHAVMNAWQPFATIPDWVPPPIEAMLEALGRLQTLSWMQRPVVIRNWVAATLKLNRNTRFSESGADALRMTCALLDSPQPPELARHFMALPEEAKVA
jgi:hypothetical protein